MKALITMLVFFNVWWTFPYPFFASTSPVYVFLSPLVCFLILLKSKFRVKKSELILLLILISIMVLSLDQITFKSAFINISIIILFICYKHGLYLISAINAFVLLTIVILIIAFLERFSLVDTIFLTGGFFGFRLASIFYEPSHLAFSYALPLLVLLFFHTESLSNIKKYTLIGGLGYCVLFCHSSTLAVLIILTSFIYTVKSWAKMYKGKRLLVLGLIGIVIPGFLTIEAERIIAVFGRASGMDLSELMFVTSVSTILDGFDLFAFFNPLGIGNIINFFATTNVSQQFLNLAAHDGLTSFVLVREMGIGLFLIVIVAFLERRDTRLALALLITLTFAFTRWAGLINGSWIIVATLMAIGLRNNDHSNHHKL